MESGSVPEAGSPPPLAEKSVHIWTLDVRTVHRHLDLLRSVLDEDERARAARFRRVEDSQRFISRRGALRMILGSLGGENPAALRYRYGAHGKPVPVFGSGLRIGFSASASDEIVLIAVSNGFEIGVDVERVRANADWWRIAQDHFSARERAALEALPPTLSLAGFYRAWTAKEAMLKALGVGLSEGLASVEVDLDPRRRIRLLPSELCTQWRLRSLDAGPDYSAALALPADCRIVSAHDWPRDSGALFPGSS